MRKVFSTSTTRIFLALTFSVLLFMSCVSEPSGPPGKMIRIADFTDENQIAQLYEKHKVPLVVIGSTVYLPSTPCLPSRLLSGDSEDRKLGGDTEDRQLGGDTEERSIGGDTENRQLGGDTEDRQLGGDTEDRSLGGNSEDRQLGGDTENRQLGGDTEDRRLGGDTEDRQLGGDAEERELGGDTESRGLGGDTLQIQCIKLNNESGFRILNLRSGIPVKVYDYTGLHTVESNIIIVN